ncbi:MAG TPA: A24 family peptidase [Galbitalea sp.]|jgi:leader peptidase (prepilin peptidase)/N-methyltransferase
MSVVPRLGRRWITYWHWSLAVPLVVVGLTAVGPTAASIPVFYLAVVSPHLARVDLRSRRLPNELTVPGILIGVLTLGVQSLSAGRVETVPLLAGAGYAAILAIPALTGGMGLGDVKLAAALGLGAWSPIVAVLSPAIAFLAGGIASLIVLLARGRGARIAFGPYLLGGFWAAVGLVAFWRL